ncbi:MAG: hypothetical protein AAF602_04350 [Myxococcota bacterium]
MRTAPSLVPLAVFVAAGCTGAAPFTDSGPPSAGPPGIDVTGRARDVLDVSGGSFEGLCATLLDPTTRTVDGEMGAIDTVPLADDGEFRFEDLTARPELGMVLAIDDCDDNGGRTALPTVTGLPESRYAGLLDGDVVFARAWMMSPASLAALEQGARELGQEGVLTGGGFLVGFVTTADARPQPVGGVTVACRSCGPVAPWYLDDDAADGLFGGASGPNAETDDGRGGFVVPAAPYGTWEATDTGGTLEFGSVVTGGTAGKVVVTGFVVGDDDTGPYQPGPPSPP